jgi:hypothetical protein
MRYFNHGANLPNRVNNDFCREVKACGQVTSGDIGPLGKFARRQARSERLDPHTAHEEFYKLVLDCGLSERVARSIRDNVMRAR